MSDTAVIEKHRVPQRPRSMEHRHPRCVRKSLPDAANQVTVTERPRLYHFACPLCQTEDKARREAPSSFDADTLARTLFLVPDNGYDRALMVEYLERKYQGGSGALGIRDHIPLGPLAGWIKANVQIVVLSRRPQPGKRKSPNTTRVCREDGIWVDVDVPHEQNLHEVVESAPIRVADAIVAETDLEMLYTPDLQTDELLERLNDVAYPYLCVRANHDARITLTLGA